MPIFGQNFGKINEILNLFLCKITTEKCLFPWANPWVVPGWAAPQTKILHYRPRTKYEGRLCFDTSLCVCPHLRGVPHPVDGGGTPSQVQVGGGYPIPSPGRAVPHLADRGVPHPRSGQGVPHPRSGGYPIQLMGDTPSKVWTGGGTLSQIWMGIPYSRSRWGTPHLGWGTIHLDLGWGTPPPPGPVMGYPPGMYHPPPPPPPIRKQSSIASTSYVTGGMPLAFTQEDFLVYI